MATGPYVIRLQLSSAEEMFSLAQADLFSEYRNFLTGIDYCISVLQSAPSTRPVRLEVTLPHEEPDEVVCERISRTLRRYCDHRIGYNRRERRAVRLNGASSLRVGLPIAALGFVLVYWTPHVLGRNGNGALVFDTGGWVFAWVGLWYPLDTLLFTPLSYGRENRVLRRLRDAEIVIAGVPAVHPGS